MLTRSSLLIALPFALFIQADASCEQLRDLFSSEAPSGLTVNVLASMEDGSSFEGDTLVSSYNVPLSNLPAHCRVSAQFNSSSKSMVHFELWLPEPSNWNDRFLVVGNGGWNGGVNYPDVGRGLKRGFATMSTNTGHNSSSEDGTWLRDEEASIDFGHRAMHISNVFSKQIIEAYYSKPASWSYYAGGSTGGRQGLAEVQLYPEDFDGVLIGCPVIWQTHLEAWEIYAGKGQYPTSLDTYISASQWSAVHDEVLRQCDNLDGVADGIVSDPERCFFVPERLLCGLSGSNSTTCFSPKQLANLKSKYSSWADVNNTLVFPGIAPGSEHTGIQYYTNAEAAGGFGLTFYQNAVLNDTTFKAEDISYLHVQIAEQVDSYGAISDAFSPDLTAFQANGGRLLHYHGWQDSVVNAEISTLYYRKVLAHYAGLGESEIQSVSDFYRLFMVPGQGHCVGGDGAWVVGGAGEPLPPLQNDTAHSALLALIDWRESQRAPEIMIGVKYANETVVGDTPVDLTVSFSRPSCRWPLVPKFKGGDVNNASSWAC